MVASRVINQVLQRRIQQSVRNKRSSAPITEIIFVLLVEDGGFVVVTTFSRAGDAESSSQCEELMRKGTPDMSDTVREKDLLLALLSRHWRASFEAVLPIIA